VLIGVGAAIVPLALGGIYKVGRRMVRR
jgi:membrane-associated protein